MDALWEPTLAGAYSAGDSDASVGLTVLLAALALGTICLVVLLVGSELVRRARLGREGDAGPQRRGQPPDAHVLQTPNLDELRGRVPEKRRRTQGELTAAGAAGEARSPVWTPASTEVAWWEKGRREEFPSTVVQEVEAHLMRRAGPEAKPPPGREVPTVEAKPDRSDAPETVPPVPAPPVPDPPAPDPPVPDAPATAPPATAPRPVDPAVPPTAPPDPAGPAVGAPPGGPWRTISTPGRVGPKTSAARAGSARAVVTAAQVSAEQHAPPQVLRGPVLVPPPQAEPVTPSPADLPLVRLPVTWHRQSVRVASTRESLLVLRESPALRAPTQEALWEARVARASLLSLLPLVLISRTLLAPGWLLDVLGSPTRAAGAAVLLLLGATGSVWTWRATMPPYLLFPRRARARRHDVLRVLQAHERLALRLAAGASPEDAWRAARRPGDPADKPEATVEAAVMTVAHLRADLDDLPRAWEGQVATVAVLPFLTCLLPAIVLAVLL